MKTDNTDIYIDLKHLHGLLYKAQFTMTRGDRIIMGNRLLDLCQNCVTILSRAANAPNNMERLEHLSRLQGEFDAFRLNIQIAENLRMFKEKLPTVDRENGEKQRIGPLVLSMFDRVAKIDDGIGKWQRATRAKSNLIK